jgi:hypothetical protein
VSLVFSACSCKARHAAAGSCHVRVMCTSKKHDMAPQSTCLGMHPCLSGFSCPILAQASAVEQTTIHTWPPDYPAVRVDDARGPSVLSMIRWRASQYCACGLREPKPCYISQGAYPNKYGLREKKRFGNCGTLAHAALQQQSNSTLRREV